MRKYFTVLILVFGLFLSAGLVFHQAANGAVLLPGCVSTSGYSTTTGQPCLPPASVIPTPANLRFNNVSSNTATISWDAVSAVNSSDPKSGFYLLKQIGTSSWTQLGGAMPIGYQLTYLVDTTLLPDTSYSYKVVAYTSTAQSYVSDPITFRTKAVIVSICLKGYILDPKTDTCVIAVVPPIATNITISGVSGPQSLYVGQEGTWTINASHPSGGSLSYSVVWGDESSTSTNSLAGQSSSIQQEATFTHSYNNAVTYKPKFTVTSENTIRCVTTPCPSNGESASVSLSVNVISSLVPVTVLYPNGGETWIKGTRQSIKWQDNTPIPICPAGAYCAPSAAKFYDIYLNQNYLPCAGDICSMMPTIMPVAYTIAKRIYGASSASYHWTVGKTSDGIIVPDGSYTIQVCLSGSKDCDSSNSYLKITSSSPERCLNGATNPPMCTIAPPVPTPTPTPTCLNGATNPPICTITPIPVPTASELSDLIVESVTPSTATVGVQQTYTAVIKNSGTEATGVTGKITHLFQFDSNANHSSGVISRSVSRKNIVADGTDTISYRYIFSNIGSSAVADKYMRVCADSNAALKGIETDTSITSKIAELKEDNNCSPWMVIKVSLPPPTANVLDALRDADGIESSMGCKFTTTLRMGMNHPEVQCLQKTLNAKGYNVSGTEEGKETTYFGNATSNALESFQDVNYLSIDGIFGPNSMDVLTN